MHYAALILVLLFSATLPAAVYKWVDPEGNVSYSDIPDNPNAKQLDLPESSRYQPRLPESRGPEGVPQKVSPGVRVSEQGSQRVLEIVQPENNATLRSNEGVVPVVLLLNPDLEDGQYLQLMLDGTPVEGRHVSTSMQLVGVDRGPHVLQARLMDESGQTVISSASLRFTMRQASRRDPKRTGTGDPTPIPGADPNPGKPTGPAGSAYNPSFAPKYTP